MSEFDLGPAEGRRVRRVNGGASTPEMVLDGKKVVQFSSNNYLGLSTHPRVVAALRDAAAVWGGGTGASALLSGHLGIHAELEIALARGKGAERALLFATGSAANLGCMSALAGGEDQIFLDKADHATLYDGARLSGAGIARFPHQDVSRLETLLSHAREVGSHRIVVAVDGIYSMDGDIAPVPALLELCGRYGAWLVVDEAHCTGVLGERGHGILEHFGITSWPEKLVLTGTLSKALGGLGGFVAGSNHAVEWIMNKARSYIFATSLPGPNAAAALEALRVMQEEPEHLRALRRNVKDLRAALARGGWTLDSGDVPIIPLRVGDASAALLRQAALLEAGYYVPAIRPPTVPAAACRLRLSVTASHTEAMIQGVVKAIGAP